MWFFYSFWWLIFPLMGFIFGGFGMWMNYRAQRDRMELLRSYAAQGKDPAELAKLLAADNAANAPPGGPNGWYGPAYGYGYGRWSRWGWWGPMREWRRFIIFTCLAVGFGVASQYSEWPGTEHAFVLVAIIMGVLAVGSLAFAVLSSVMSADQRKHDL